MAKSKKATETTPDEGLIKIQEALDKQTKSATPVEVVAEKSEQSEKVGKTEEPKTEQSEKETTEQVSKFPDLTDKQVQAAKHLGYADEDIAELSPQTAARVERESASRHRVESKMGRQDQRLDKLLEKFDAFLESRGSQTIRDAKSELGGTPATGEGMDEVLSKLEDLSPDSADVEEVIQQQNALMKVIKAERSARLSEKKAMDKAKSDKQEVVNRKEARGIDEFFENLDSDVFDDFGQGPTAELNEYSLEAETRRDLISKAKRIRQIHVDDGEDVPMRQCLDEALVLVLPEKYRKAAQKPLSDEIPGKRRKGPAKPSANVTLPKSTDPAQEARLKMMEKVHSMGKEMSEV